MIFLAVTADSWLELIFHQKIFLIFFGLMFYFVLLWSFARNKVSKLRDERLKLCNSKAERALVYAEDTYSFSFKAWLHDQKDEMVVSLMAALLLIEFDDVAVGIINQSLDTPIEAGNWVYLTGGVLGALFYKGIKKLLS